MMRFELEFFPYPAVFGTLLLLVLLFHSWRKQHSWPYLFFLSVFWVYILVVLTMIFFPIRIPQEWPGNITPQNILDIFSHVNIIPFNFGYLFTANSTVIFEQLIGNILLTLPFGFSLPFLVYVPGRRIFWVALFSGLALEGMQLLIELLGIISGYGHAIDINDVILNSIGVLVGYGLYRTFAWFYRALTSRLRLPTSAMFQYLNKVTMQKTKANKQVLHES
ncbi:MAG: VanZ family protein [Anaerolineaceae bacterium]|jgi:glycopeptide antibiotics resistance protein